VNVSRDQAKAENVEDKIFHVGQEEKGPHLLSLLRKHRPRQAIIFSNFKMNVPRLTQFLNENGLPAVGISSLLTQSQRNRVMEQFKGAGDQNILVATDVAARGLDVKGVDMVVNFELPDDPENYVHRIGRTGRAGEKGIAFSLVSDRDVDALSRVEQYLKHRVEIGFLEETELVKEFKAMPRAERESRFAGGSGGRSYRGPRPGGRDGGQRAGGPRSESGAPRDGARDGGGRDGGRRGGRSGRGPDRGGDRPNDRPNDRAANGAASDAAPRAGAAPMNGEGRPHSSARPQRGPDGRSSEARGGRGRNNGSRGAAQGPSQGASRPGSSAAAAGSPNSRHGSRPNSRAPHGQNGNGSRGPSRPNVGGKPSAQVGKPTASANSNASIGKKVGSFFKRLFGG
jgi:ATP-dependent RNA helicase RhlB